MRIKGKKKLRKKQFFAELTCIGKLLKLIKLSAFTGSAVHKGVLKLQSYPLSRQYKDTIKSI